MNYTNLTNYKIQQQCRGIQNSQINVIHGLITTSINQEYLGQSLVCRLNGGSTFDNLADLELHLWIVASGSKFGTVRQFAKDLIANLIRVAIEVREANRCRWNH